MRSRLDLNILLAKYEGMAARNSPSHSLGYSPGYSPARAYEYRADEPIELQLNRSRGHRSFQQENRTHSYPISHSFQMSKSECQQYLLSIREQFRNEERNLEGFASQAHQEIHKKFQANHEAIKREILELLDKAFRDSQRQISEQLKKQGNNEPLEFQSVHRRIFDTYEYINQLLEGLQGQDYKKYIAETVVKDFNAKITEIKYEGQAAKQSYIQSLGEVEPDRTRIDCIRQDLQRLFRLSQKNANLVQKSLSHALGINIDSDNRRAAATMYNDNRQNPNRMQKKSFFDFGFE